MTGDRARREVGRTVIALYGSVRPPRRAILGLHVGGPQLLREARACGPERDDDLRCRLRPPRVGTVGAHRRR